MTGRLRSRRSSRCSTDAKKASRSAWRIVAGTDTNVCSHRSRPSSAGQPALPIPGMLSGAEALPHGRVGLLRVGRLLLHAGAVAQRDLVDGVAAPPGTVLVLSRSDREDHASVLARADDRVLRVRRTVDEVPLTERPLLSLDDEERLAVHDEEVLLIGLPVVHRHRLSRREA